MGALHQQSHSEYDTQLAKFEKAKRVRIFVIMILLIVSVLSFVGFIYDKPISFDITIDKNLSQSRKAIIVQNGKKVMIKDGGPLENLQEHIAKQQHILDRENSKATVEAP